MVDGNPPKCCDGNGQVHHGSGALSFVTLCPNGCGSKAWDEDCEQAASSPKCIACFGELEVTESEFAHFDLLACSDCGRAVRLICKEDE